MIDISFVVLVVFLIVVWSVIWGIVGVLLSKLVKLVWRFISVRIKNATQNRESGK